MTEQNDPNDIEPADYDTERYADNKADDVQKVRFFDHRADPDDNLRDPVDERDQKKNDLNEQR